MQKLPSYFDQKGMTLIEIMVVVFIIASTMALGATILFPGNEAKLRDQSVKLASLIKFLYNEAAIKNKYYRLVFDIDHSSYRVESSVEPFFLSVSEEMPDEKKSFPKQTPDADATPIPDFSQEEGSLVKPVQFPSGIKIKDIRVVHLPELVDRGQVETYFFPNGWAEKMVINLSDEDEQSFYSIEVNPLTGKAKIRSEYLEVKPEDFSVENPSS